MLVVMSCTMLAAAPITIVGGVIMALRQDAGLTWLLVVSILALMGSLSLIVRRMVPHVPADAGAHRRDQRGAPRADHPACGSCGPSSASRSRCAASAT